MAIEDPEDIRDMLERQANQRINPFMKGLSMLTGGIAGEFDVRGGPVLAQECERGQGDDKITEGAASKDEDFAHP